MKCCSKCKEIKSINEFYKKKNGKYGIGTWCKKCFKEFLREYYIRNAEKIREYRKEYCKNNPEKVKEYYKNNLKRINEYRRKWKKNNLTKIRKQNKEYYKNNIKKMREYFNEYCKNNPEKMKEKYKKRYEIIKSNSKLKLSKAISSSIRHSLKNSKNSNHWERLVNFTLKDLMTHLEKLFKPEMSFNNHGMWHIDHRQPISSFSFTSYEDEEFKKCWALENLQPLWASENISKGNRIIIK